MSAVSVPAYRGACIAPSRTGSSVFLAGVPVANEGRLELYNVDLTNINSPTATFLGNQSSPVFWSSAASRACFSYPGNQADTNSPMFMVQFGPKSFFTNMFPNGTIDDPIYFSTTLTKVIVAYSSPKLFSMSGAVGKFNWYSVMSNFTSATTGSSWISIRSNATLAINSTVDATLSVYPTANPLLSVGTYTPTSTTPAQGNQFVFDTQGGAIAYTTLDSGVTYDSTSQDHLMTLTTPQTVDMGGIKLTNNAIPVTMVTVAYILDTDATGGTILYTISGSTLKLARVPFTGNVPPFSNYMSATSLNSQIITYGSSASGIATATFNSFDTITGQWSGPGLIVPAPVPSPSTSSSGTPKATGGSDSGNKSSGSNVGAIAGGVVGGLVVIAAIIFFFFRQRRKNNNTSSSAPPPVPNASTKPEFASSPLQYATTPAPQYQQIPVMQQQHHQQQQQQNFNNFATPQQSMAYNPHQSYYEPNPNGGFSQPMSPIVQPQQSPLPQPPSPNIFQAQQQPQPTYSYVPPTLGVAAVEPQNPNIFQPQASPLQSASGSATTPQTPYTQQVHTPSSGPASPQYGHNHGYVS
ncbi:hypothetical protein BGZ83_009166 [Gryganskiella cystojenkinii]|nr:hypothetical protein BGZ83_009166 [Gryganskiella cystojenkinii]